MNAPAYERRGNRISLLPVSFYCPTAAKLSEEHGAGRAAFKSSAFHAMHANAPNARQLLALLDADEREEVESWHRPTTIVITEGEETITLDYDSADKEVPLGLDSWGGYVPHSSEDAVTSGTADMGWVRTLRGQRVAYVPDIKKTRWTTTDGPDSLQVHAYAMAYASKHECDAYVTGIWVADEGLWLWMAGEPIALDSPRAAEVLARIVAAAGNTEGRPVHGRHCRDCWGRLHCGEHVLVAAAAQTQLAPLAAGHAPVNTEEAVRLLGYLEAGEEVFKKARENLKAAVERGLRVAKDGKRWKSVKCNGRESALSAKDLRARLGPEAEKLIKRGEPFYQFRWVSE